MFTYQQVINMARSRHPQFRQLVLDDKVAIDEINQIALDVLLEVEQDDFSAVGRRITWAVNIAPVVPLP